MFTPTNLPTDNLYKFIALSGVALTSIILVLSIGTLGGLQDDLAAIEGKIATHTKLLNAPDANSTALYLAAAELHGNLIELELRAKYSFIFSVILAIFLIATLALALYGFKAWYYRIQVYEDALLKKQAEKFDNSNNTHNE